MSTLRGRASFGGVPAAIGSWLAVVSMAILVSASDADAAGSAAEVIERADVGSDGAQTNSVTFRPFLSADGRFVAFDTASPLVAHDTNGFADIYVRDRVTHVTERSAVASDGSQTIGGPSCHASLSADGRFVAFQSDVSNLVPNDTNGASDVFVRDRLAGTTTRVSVTNDGTQGNQPPGGLCF